MISVSVTVYISLNVVFYISPYIIVPEHNLS